MLRFGSFACLLLATTTRANGFQGIGDNEAIQELEGRELSTVLSSDGLGCFKAKKFKRVFDKKMKLDNMTPESCASECHTEFLENNYQYYGVSNGNMCWCLGSDTQHRMQKAVKGGSRKMSKPSKCKEECAGDQDATCGGHKSIDAFEIIELSMLPIEGPVEYAYAD